MATHTIRRTAQPLLRQCGRFIFNNDGGSVDERNVIGFIFDGINAPFYVVAHDRRWKRGGKQVGDFGFQIIRPALF